MKLIVGLGNPGRKYRKTRHNIGFMFVDSFVKELNQKFKLDKTLKCEISTFGFYDEKIIVIKPQTYMNLSGEAVYSVYKYYNLEINDIIVIYDDLDLPEGKIRIRKGGSSGGHKGMRNIINLFNTEEIKRIRIGIGKDTSVETRDYVLSKLSKDEEITFSLITSHATEMIEYFLTHNFEDFMGKYN